MQLLDQAAKGEVIYRRASLASVDHDFIRLREANGTERFILLSSWGVVVPRVP